MAEIVRAGKILAFDTSAAVCSVALQIGNEISFVHQHAPMQQAKLILPQIQSLLDAASLSIAELDAVAYGCGPGSFTGLRIASSIAQGLAYAAKLPVIPVSSLAVLAQTVFFEQNWRKLVVITDARMGEVYYGAYQIGAHDLAEALIADSVAKPDRVSIGLSLEGYYGVGDGFNVYPDELMKSLQFSPVAVQTMPEPSAKALLALAQQQFKRGEVVTVFDAVPVYLR